MKYALGTEENIEQQQQSHQNFSISAMKISWSVNEKRRFGFKVPVSFRSDVV